ncbi:hypothetical protein [Streptomyces sp. NPDC051014]|uniref:hypothetical protein n=1 Tax=Streptomyces sp. NPDC051014 TaxID=3155751 RepID=UPI0033DF6636
MFPTERGREISVRSVNDRCTHGRLPTGLPDYLCPHCLRPAGRPYCLYCPYCWEMVRPSAALCAGCGYLPTLLTFRQDSLCRCRRCHQATAAPCAHCGAVTKAKRHWPVSPICLTFMDTVRFTHAACTTCHRYRPVFGRAPC